jgi:hypothetical protein
MIRSSSLVSYCLILALLGGSTFGYALDLNIKANVGPVHIDTSHPLQPVTTDPIKVPGGTITPPAPGLVPATPSVQLNKDVPGAEIINPVDRLLHAPERATQDGVNAIGKGIEHIGNEIGMFWARLKQKASDMIQSWIDWFWRLVEKYAPLAIAILFGAMTLAAVIVVYVPQMVMALFRRRQRLRKAKVRHA